MRVLAIVAHPDDAGIFCGGTLAKHADRGDDVAVVHMTRGEYGGIDTTTGAVADVRETEAKAEGSELGVDTAFLDFHDGRITYSMENRLALVDVLREYEPDAVITHYRDDTHPDHRATSRLVTDAYYMSSLPLVETEAPPHDVDNVYYFGKQTAAFDPDVFVDISGYQDQKERAIQAHESQVEFLQEHGGIDAEFDNLLEGVRADARVAGKQSGVRYAEPFAAFHETAMGYLG